MQLAVGLKRGRAGVGEWEWSIAQKNPGRAVGWLGRACDMESVVDAGRSVGAELEAFGRGIWSRDCREATRKCVPMGGRSGSRPGT